MSGALSAGTVSAQEFGEMLKRFDGLGIKEETDVADLLQYLDRNNDGRAFTNLPFSFTFRICCE